MGNNVTQSDNLYLQRELQALGSSVSALQQLSLESKGLPSTTTVPVRDNELLNKTDTARLTLCNSLLNTLNDLGQIGTTIQQMDQKLMSDCEALSSEFGISYASLGVDLRNTNIQLTWNDFDLSDFDHSCTVIYKGKAYPLDYYCYAVIMAEGEGWKIYKDYRDHRITKEQMLARYGAEIIVARTYILNNFVRKGSNVIINNGGTAAGKERWLERNLNMFYNQSYGRTQEAPIYAAYALQAAMETSGQVLISSDNKSGDPRVGNGLSIANGRFAASFQNSVRSSRGTTPAQVLNETYLHGQLKADLGYNKALSIGEVSLNGTRVPKINKVTSLLNANQIGTKTVKLQLTGKTTPSIVNLNNKTQDPNKIGNPGTYNDYGSRKGSGSKHHYDSDHGSDSNVKPAPTVVVPEKTDEINTTPTPVEEPVKEPVREDTIVTTEPIQEPQIVRLENNPNVQNQTPIQTIKVNDTYKPTKNYSNPVKSETVNTPISDIATEPMIIEDEPYIDDTIIDEPVIDEPEIDNYIEEPIIDNQTIDIEPPTTVVENKHDGRNIGGIVGAIAGIGAIGVAGAYAVKKAKEAEDEEE